MTLDEAIERLQEDIASTGDDERDTLTEAEQLGSEALEAIKDIRNSTHNPYWLPLPGETKD